MIAKPKYKFPRVQFSIFELNSLYVIVVSRVIFRLAISELTCDTCLTCHHYMSISRKLWYAHELPLSVLPFAFTVCV